jgi:dipeptidyl aminopeptidase/acylaminoacyl peptidase
VYTVRSFDVEKNSSRTDLWLQNLRDTKAAPKKLTNNAPPGDGKDNSKGNGDGNNTSPAWSASGDAIYFLSTRSGSDQVWRMAISNSSPATPAKVSDLPLPVESFKLAPQEKRIALSIEVFRDCPDLACSKARLDKMAQSKTAAIIHDQLLFQHWASRKDGRRQVLFSAALDGNHSLAEAPVNLSGSIDADVHAKPFGDQNDYTFSPDGQSIVFAAKAVGKAEAWSTNFDLFKVPAAGGAAPQNLTPQNKAWDAQPAFSPDGNTLAYLAMKHPGFEADRFQIMLMDTASGKQRKLAENWDRSAQDLRWSDDGKTLYSSAHDLGQLRLFAIDVASGKVSAQSGPGNVNHYDVRGQSIVIAQANLASGTQLFYRPSNQTGQADQGNWQQISHVNQSAQADIGLAQYEQFSYSGAKGDKVHGYVMKPWNAKAGEKYPLVLFVHGGPQGSFANNWTYRMNPQVLAGAGYAVLFIDIHGSLGYGQRFTDSVSQDWGGAPLVDLKLGMAHAAKQFAWLDGKNACAMGVSYGGFMMNWIEGNWPDGFKCIINHAGAFDQRSMYYSTDELWFNEWENGGTYYDVPAKHEKFNPANHVKKWKTPMLVTQGEMDFRIPSTQSFATFTALQRRGIESRLLVIPDEGHIFGKPANSLVWNNTILDWLGRYLKK